LSLSLAASTAAAIQAAAALSAVRHQPPPGTLETSTKALFLKDLKIPATLERLLLNNIALPHPQECLHVTQPTEALA
jgi:hypothetical protein